MKNFPINIITCPQWGARKPKQGIEMIGMSKETVMHHTNGHVRDIGRPGITVEDAMQYARDIQNYHMDSPKTGWNDSGHNFLIVRAGFILQGRWLTVSAIQADHMVRSAHAGSSYGNQQIGIEFEHAGNEQMTPEQFESGAQLLAWIAFHYNKPILPMFPHRHYSSTACPVNLESKIQPMRARATTILKQVRSL